MANKNKKLVISKAAEVLQKRKLLNLNVSAQDILAVTQEIGKLDPSGEVSFHVIAIDGYVLITPKIELPDTIGIEKIKDLIKGKIK